MGGLGIDARDKLEVAANATVTVGDGTNFGNVHVGDNGQFIAGAGGDLRIFHNPNHSVIQEQGSGNLFIDSTNLNLRNGSGSETLAVFTDGGSAELYHNNIKKFETSAVGAKITGNADITANVGISGNAFVGTYLAIANTNPAATDALVVNGNLRLTAGQIIFADGSGQSVGSSVTAFPTGDYGLLDSANSSTDAFGQVTAGLTTFDMLSQPTGSVDTEDLGALS